MQSADSESCYLMLQPSSCCSGTVLPAHLFSIRWVKPLAECLQCKCMSSEGCMDYWWASHRLHRVTLVTYFPLPGLKLRATTTQEQHKVLLPVIVFQVQVKQHLIRRLNEHQSWEPVAQVPISWTDSGGKSAAIAPGSPALCRCTVISPSAYNSLTITGVSPFVIREICFVDSFGRKPIWVFDAITHH